MPGRASSGWCPPALLPLDPDFSPAKIRIRAAEFEQASVDDISRNPTNGSARVFASGGNNVTN